LIVEAWDALGPLGPCLVLFLGGCVLTAGFFFNWTWLSPGKSPTRNLDSTRQRRFMLLTGILLIVCSVVFFTFRDRMYWN
jgi:hypothetical protein